MKASHAKSILIFPTTQVYSYIHTQEQFHTLYEAITWEVKEIFDTSCLISDPKLLATVLCYSLLAFVSLSKGSWMP